MEKLNPDFVIKPIDGFGNKEMLRVILATEKPDIIFLFTDPRFFLWLFENAIPVLRGFQRLQVYWHQKDEQVGPGIGLVCL